MGKITQNIQGQTLIRSKFRKICDLLAINVSALCLIHCLLPLSNLLLLPIISIEAGNAAKSHTHLWVLLVAILSAGLALSIGYRQHRHAFIPLGGLLGLGLLLIGVSFPATTSLTSTLSSGQMLTITGSLMLVIAHLINWRLCAQAKL